MARMTARQRAESVAAQQLAAAQQSAIAPGLSGQFTAAFEGGGPKLGRAIDQQSAMDAAAFAQGLEQQALQRQADAPGQLAALQAAGIDTRQVPGLMGALEQGGAGVTAGLLSNPQAPLMSQAQAIRDAERAATQQAAVDKRMATLSPLVGSGRNLENIRSMRNLLAQEGRMSIAGSPERGAYSSLRGQLLNAIREQFEAGALQQAELEFFETLLPSADAFTTSTQGERMAMINELEYQFRTKLQDDIALSGIDGLHIDHFAGPGRSVTDILTGGIPKEFQPGTGQTVRQTNTLGDMMEANPGAGFPAPGFSPF